MKSSAKSILCLGMLSSSAIAWSAGPSPSNRRGFLQNAKKAAVIIGTASVIGGGVLVENAQAASTLPSGTSKSTSNKNKIYQPLPNSLTGQVHVITGASSGLGLESAKRLAAAGATVVMTTRTAAKADVAKSQVQEYLEERSITNNQDNIYVLTLDMDDLANVRSFPDRYSKLLGSRKIDVLMNNIGTISQSRKVTNDSFEKTFQSNHLAPFLLTANLFPQMNRNGARIVNVASRAHEFAKVVKTGERGLDMENLNGEVSYGFDGWEAYGNTKLENVLFTQELQRRANDAGLSWLTVVALHPGVVGTDLWNHTALAKSDKKNSLQSFTSGLLYNNALSTEEGANTQVMLASSDISGIAKGRYYDEFGQVVDLAPFARDEKKARELWEVSESLSSCKFNVE
jgi:NAD(P)-dependent dehydrogenase (short-subunit alcohol dehydrogenase family)